MYQEDLFHLGSSLPFSRLPSNPQAYKSRDGLVSVYCMGVSKKKKEE